MKSKVARLMLEKGDRNISQMDATLRPNWNPKSIQNAPKETKGSQRSAIMIKEDEKMHPKDE